MISVYRGWKRKRFDQGTRRIRGRRRSEVVRSRQLQGARTLYSRGRISSSLFPQYVLLLGVYGRRETRTAAVVPSQFHPLAEHGVWPSGNFDHLEVRAFHFPSLESSQEASDVFEGPQWTGGHRRLAKPAAVPGKGFALDSEPPLDEFQCVKDG